MILLKSEESSPTKGSIFEIIGKFYLDLAMQHKAILGGSTFKFRLQLNDPSFYFITNDPKLTPYLRIHESNCHIKRIRVTNDIAVAHSHALKLTPARYPITRSEVKAMTIPANVSNAFLDNIIIGRYPNKIFLALIHNKAFLGDYSKNPFNLQDFGLIYAACYVNGVQHANTITK